MKVRVSFEVHDLWVGIFWRFTYGPGYNVAERRHRERTLLIYVCLLPMLPIAIALPAGVGVDDWR